MRTHCQQHCSKQLQANTQCLPLSKAVRQQIHWCFISGCSSPPAGGLSTPHTWSPQAVRSQYLLRTSRV